MEVFRDAVFALKCQHITAQFLRTIACGFRRHFREVGSRFLGRPFRLKQARRILRPRQIHQGIQTIGANNAGADMSFHFRLKLLVANLRLQLHAALIHQRPRRHRRFNGARRLSHQPAQKLLPKKIVRRIAQRLAHLPAPCAARRHDRRAAMAVIFHNEERQLARSRVQIRQDSGARLGRASVLIVGQIGQFLPSLFVLRWVVEQSSNRRVHASRGQLHGRAVAMEVVSPRWKKSRKQLVHARRTPGSIAQRRAATKEQYAAAPAIDILAQ